MQDIKAIRCWLLKEQEEQEEDEEPEEVEWEVYSSLITDSPYNNLETLGWRNINERTYTEHKDPVQMGQGEGKKVERVEL